LKEVVVVALGVVKEAVAAALALAVIAEIEMNELEDFSATK
jgi:hypothetical protein